MNGSNRIQERPMAVVLGSIVGNVQVIVRSEIRLIKSEVVEEVAQLKSALPRLVIGVTAAFYAVGLFALGFFFMLLNWLPPWASALSVSGGLLIISMSALLIHERRTPPRLLE